jgi:hypothetical protein
MFHIISSDELSEEELYPFVTLPSVRCLTEEGPKLTSEDGSGRTPSLTGCISTGYLDHEAYRLTEIMSCLLLLIGTMTHINARYFLCLAQGLNLAIG